MHGIFPQVIEPSLRHPGEREREKVAHLGGASTRCSYGGGVNVQKLKRVGLSVVWPYCRRLEPWRKSRVLDLLRERVTRWSALSVSPVTRSSFVEVALIARRITRRGISASSWRVGASARISFTACEGSGLRHLLVSVHAGISFSAGHILRRSLVATLFGPGGGRKGRLQGARKARFVRSVCDLESTMRQKSPIWVVPRSSMDDRGER